MKLKMVIDNKIDGHFYSRFANGNIQIVGNYSKGKKNGYFEEFHENGKLKTQCFYKDDLLHGYVEKYNEEGISITIEKFNLGISNSNFGITFEFNIILTIKLIL